MCLTDNNLPLDDELLAVVEEFLIFYLEKIPQKKWFVLSELYEELGIKYTQRRVGTLDKMISQKLDEWKWQRHPADSEQGMVSYVRREYLDKPSVVKSVDGDSHSIWETWPSYVKRRPHDPHAAETTKSKLLAILRRQ